MVTGVGDLPCFTAFYFYGPYSNLKFPIFPSTCYSKFCYVQQMKKMTQWEKSCLRGQGQLNYSKSLFK